MLDMSAVIKSWQCAQQAQPSDRAPAHKFNQSVTGIRVRRNKHRAARVFAVVERQKQRTSLVPIRIVIAAQREGAAVQLHNTNENAEQISQMAKRFERTVCESSNVGGETNAQEIKRIDFAARVCQANQIHRALPAFAKRLERSLSAFVCEIAQKRIARTQRQKTKRNAWNPGAPGKNAIQDFVSGAIAADGKKVPVALIVGLAGKLHSVTLAGRSDDVNLQSFLAQTCESRSRKFRGAAATGGGVDDGEETIHFERERNRNANSCLSAYSQTVFTTAESQRRCPASPGVLPNHGV